MHNFRLHTLFEHEALAYEKWGWSVEHTCVEQIEAINRESKVELIQLGRKGLRAKQYVGMMQVGDERIQVLPKIDDRTRRAVEDNESKIASAAVNLMVMMTYAENMRIHPLDLAQIGTQRGSWMEWLIFLYASELQRQLRLGVQRAYTEREETLPLIRGKWALSRQFTRHPVLVDQFDVRYADFSANTVLNRVLLRSTTLLMRLTQKATNYRLLQSAYATMVGAGCNPGTALEAHYAELIHFTRLEERFRTAYQLADLFLQGSVTNIFQGRRQYPAFMFDMNVLFEGFVAGFLRRHKGRIFGGKAEATRIVAQAKQQRVPLLRRESSGQTLFKLKPDLLIYQDGQLRMIGDTKYKTLDMDEQHRNMSESDSYQMLAYATAYRCEDVCLIYPQAQNHAFDERYRITNHPSQLRIASVNLQQRLDEPEGLIDEFSRIFTYEKEEVRDAAI